MIAQVLKLQRLIGVSVKGLETMLKGFKTIFLHLKVFFENKLILIEFKIEP